MRRLALFFCACAGKDADPAADGPALDCDELPTYAFEELSCEQLAYAFERTVRAALSCSEDADCQALHPPCEHWSEVDCYYAVNRCFTPERLAPFDQHTADCTAVGTMTYTGCVCDAPPEVGCVQGSCTAL